MSHVSSLSRTTWLILALALAFVVSAPAQSTDTAAHTPPTTEAPDLVQEYQALIQPDELESQVRFFASDRFKGRETLRPEKDKAAEYLASEYQRMGVAPKGTKEVDDPRALENYFQPFTVYGHQLQEAQISLHEDPDEEPTAQATYSLDGADGHVLPVFGNLESSEGGVVFAGHGIGEDDAFEYNDYEALADQEIGVEGQWVVILRDEPMDDDGNSLLTEDGSPSEWTEQWTNKLQRAFMGAMPAGILVVADTGPHALDVETRAQQMADFAEPGDLSLEDEPLEQNVPPVHAISSEWANHLLEHADRTVEEVSDEITETQEPVVFDVPDVTLRSELDHEPLEGTTDNVLGYVEGQDPELKDEVIVITSHYDHIGVSSLGPDGNYINNGADDNATGTIATLALANAFQQAAEDGHGPRRSILFLNVAAEEKGLLGSAYYADEEPVFPLENTVTNINLDMIGRIDPTFPELPDSNYVYVIGGDLISDDLAEANRQTNELTDINFTLHDRYNDPDHPDQLFRRSDQWNFAKHNIPFIFYFTGLHEDYHDVGDEAHKITYDRMAEITRLTFGTVWEIANRDDPPEVTQEIN